MLQAMLPRQQVAGRERCFPHGGVEVIEAKRLAAKPVAFIVLGGVRVGGGVVAILGRNTLD